MKQALRGLSLSANQEERHMTYAEASAVMKAEVDEDLLEALEYIQHNLNMGLVVPARVRIAYHTLMAGFTELFAED